MSRPRMTKRWIVLGCVLALVLSGGLWWVAQAGGTRITAHFDKATGMYPDSSVRVLGVEVGRITEVHPEGGQVRVEMTVDDGVSIPADAKAVVVAPSLVSDRYVQLTPAYTGGKKMASGAVMGRERTTTPAELDDLYRSANALSEALGPKGANREGAVSDALRTGAANLDGNGAKINETIKRLGDLAGTLSDSRGDLFATVDNLNKFTKTLAESDSQIQEFYGRVDEVTGFLAAEKDQTAVSLNALAGALTEVETFVRDNRQLVSSNVENLTGVTQALVKEKEAFAEVLDIAPTGASNYLNAYDAASGTVAVRAHINELTHPPILMVCKLIQASVPQPIPQHIARACERLQPVLDGKLKLPSVAETTHHLSQGELPPLPVPLGNALTTEPQASGGPR